MQLENSTEMSQQIGRTRVNARVQLPPRPRHA
nr:MAG TPA: hypothetical protein [Caudoviricetes sp.]